MSLIFLALRVAAVKTKYNGTKTKGNSYAAPERLLRRLEKTVVRRIFNQKSENRKDGTTGKAFSQ